MRVHCLSNRLSALQNNPICSRNQASAAQPSHWFGDHTASTNGCATAANLKPVCAALRKILAPFEKPLALATDEPDRYALNTRQLDVKKRPNYSGGVRTMKSHVSLHLMPVYVFPDLLEGASPALRRRPARPPGAQTGDLLSKLTAAALHRGAVRR